ncbi:MAG: hypothetical protein R3F43_25300 [bacterium]
MRRGAGRDLQRRRRRLRRQHGRGAGAGVRRRSRCTGEQVCAAMAPSARARGWGRRFEDCNNADDDCDGAVDEGDFFELGCDFRADTCRAGQCVCGNGSRCPDSRAECINGRCVIIQ